MKAPVPSSSIALAWVLRGRAIGVSRCHPGAGGGEWWGRSVAVVGGGP